MKPINKRSYVKPMIVYEDYGTDELKGSPEMIEQSISREGLFRVWVKKNDRGRYYRGK